MRTHCRRGHELMSDDAQKRQCPICAREWERAYYLKNRDKKLARSRASYERNREYHYQYGKAWTEKNRDYKNARAAVYRMNPEVRDRVNEQQSKRRHERSAFYRAQSKKRVEALTDVYVRQCMRQQGFTTEFLRANPEWVEAYRLNLKLKRAAKAKQRGGHA